MHSLKRTNKKKNSCIFIHPTYIFQQGKIKLHSNQQKILLKEKTQYKVKMKNNDPLISVQGQNQEQRPSRLSTRSKSRTTTLSSQYKVKIKNNDLLVSIQGQNQEQRPSRLSTRSKSRTTTLSSQYKVKIKKNDPLVSVQGQFKSKIYSPLCLSTRSV